MSILSPIRYFVLSNNGLSYSKTRSDGVIHTIPIGDMQAVERVDELAFNMKFVSASCVIMYMYVCVCVYGLLFTMKLHNMYCTNP